MDAGAIMKKSVCQMDVNYVFLIVIIYHLFVNKI